MPGPHYQGDVRDILGGGWTVLIGHPTCTYLASSGIHWNRRRPGRAAKTEEAVAFFRLLLSAPIPYIALENPVGVISTRIRKPDQIIQPYQFGADASKKTCLWLKGLPPLQPTQNVAPRLVCCGTVVSGVCAMCAGAKSPRPRWANQTNSGQNKLSPAANRGHLRSITYPGVAAAMAAQWCGVARRGALLLRGFDGQ